MTPLERVRERVEEQLRATVAGEGLLGAAAAHLTAAPSAKRARPRLLLAFVRLAGGSLEDERVVRAAVAVELIHTASLLHDDVVDEASERRALPSTNARFGNGAAVLAGDVVLARALTLLSYDVRALQAAIDAVARMSAAAVREIEVRGDIEVTPEQALVIAEGKTGALFGLCGALAGLMGAPARETSDAFDAAGRAFGVAFQLADDIDDLEGDLRERSPTVPLLLGARDPQVRRALSSLWRSSDRSTGERAGERAILSAVKAGAALVDARALVENYVARARAALSPFASAPGHDEIVGFAESLGRARKAA